MTTELFCILMCSYHEILKDLEVPYIETPRLFLSDYSKYDIIIKLK